MCPKELIGPGRAANALVHRWFGLSKVYRVRGTGPSSFTSRAQISP